MAGIGHRKIPKVLRQAGPHVHHGAGLFAGLSDVADMLFWISV